MATYNAQISATSSGTPNTEETFLELKAEASVTYLLTHVLVTFNKGAAPASNTWTCRVKRNSAAGTATSGTTPAANKHRLNSRASSVTAVGKNTTNAFTVGTNVDTMFFGSASEYSFIEYLASRPDEYIEHSATGAYFAITLECSGASRVATVQAWWIE